MWLSPLTLSPPFLDHPSPTTFWAPAVPGGGDLMVKVGHTAMEDTFLSAMPEKLCHHLRAISQSFKERVF